MGFNKKVLSKAVSELDKAKAPAKPRDITVDPMGYWNPANQGQPVRIPGNDITMQGVPYPVWAQPNVGPGSMMQPNQDYNFPGASYVDETPMAKKGGTLQSKKYSKSMSATNKLFAKNKLFQNKKSKIFDPNAEFKTGGSKLGTINLNPNPLSHYELNYGFNLPTEEDGGEADYEDQDLTDEEIQAYRDAGYEIEELPEAQVGGPQNTAGPRAEEISTNVDAMNAMMKARMATDAAFGNSSAQRMISPNPKTYDFGNGNLGTHFMASMGNQAVPLLQDKGGNELEYNENPPPSNEDMNFRTPEEAQYFAEHYKEVAPMMKGFKKGGYVQHELAKAQKGEEKQDPDISLEDYLKLYENSLALEKGITSMPNYKLENTDTNVDDYLKQLETARNNWLEYDTVHNKNRKEIQDRLNDKKSPPTEKNRIAFEKILKEKLQPREIQDYYTVVSPNNFYQRDITNAFVNKEFTPAYYDSRIKPSSRNTYYGYRPGRDGTEETFDKIELYKYDPVEVKKQALLKYTDSEEAFQNALNKSTGNDITPLKRIQYAQSVQPKQEIIPAVPYVKLKHYRDWNPTGYHGENIEMPEGYTQQDVEKEIRKRQSAEYDKRALEYQQQEKAKITKRLKPVGLTENFKEGGTLVKAQNGKTVKPLLISDPKKYAYRKTAYDDILKIYNIDKNVIDLSKKNAIGNLPDDVYFNNAKLIMNYQDQINKIKKNSKVKHNMVKLPGNQIKGDIAKGYKKPVEPVNYIQSLQPIDKKPVKHIPPKNVVINKPAPAVQENNIVGTLVPRIIQQFVTPNTELQPTNFQTIPKKPQGPRYGTLAGDENLNLPENYTQQQREAARKKRDADEFTRKTLEYQAKQRGTKAPIAQMFQKGGDVESWEDELDDDEIKALEAAGYTIERIK